jgi:hypothetical protein
VVLTLIEHALYAAMFQAVIGLLTGNWWVGGALASSYFFGREVAQAEYRWIELFGEGLRANMPWHAVLEPKVWHNADQIADWLAPIASTLVIALLASSLKSGTAKPPHANKAHKAAPTSRP